MRSKLQHELRIILLSVIGLLAVSIWLDIYHPGVHQEDTMKYKLKYVRLRPIHEEEWLRLQHVMKKAESDSLEIELKRSLTK